MAPNTNPSGLVNFWMTCGDVVLEAFDRIQVRASSLTQQQLTSAYRSINLAVSTWANRGMNQWARDLQTINLVANQATYTAPDDTIQILDMYLRFTPPSSSSVTIDRILYPISETDYASLPNKNDPGPPTAFWYNRLSPTPLITIWPIPSVVTNLEIQYYRTRQIQDANLAQGQTPDVPYRFFEALAADVAARLAQKFRPQMWPLLKQEADAQWKEAADADAEKVNMNIYPATELYYE